MVNDLCSCDYVKSEELKKDIIQCKFYRWCAIMSNLVAETHQDYFGICKLNNVLLNNPWLVEEAMIESPKYFQLDNNVNLIYQVSGMHVKGCTEGNL